MTSLTWGFEPEFDAEDRLLTAELDLNTVVDVCMTMRLRFNRNRNHRVRPGLGNPTNRMLFRYLDVRSK